MIVNYFCMFIHFVDIVNILEAFDKDISNNVLINKIPRSSSKKKGSQ